MICSVCHEALSGVPSICPFCASPLDGAVRLVDPGPDLIAVIKAVRGLTHLGLKEAKDLVESAPTVLRGNTERIAQALREAGATVEITGAGPVEPSTGERQREVALLSAGSNLIDQIRILREATGLGLKEARDLIQGASKTLARLPSRDAERLYERLRAAGAEVDLR